MRRPSARHVELDLRLELRQLGRCRRSASSTFSLQAFEALPSRRAICSALSACRLTAVALGFDLAALDLAVGCASGPGRRP